MPDEETKVALEKCFDEIFATETCSEVLDAALRRVAKNKAELLLVPNRPDIPLHNNLSERDIREYVKKRKISGRPKKHAVNWVDPSGATSTTVSPMPGKSRPCRISFAPRRNQAEPAGLAPEDPAEKGLFEKLLFFSPDA